MRFINTLKLIAIVLVVATVHSAAAQTIVLGDCPGGVCPPRVLPPVGNGPPVDTRAVVRIVNAQGMSKVYGSGTLVAASDRQGLILTCAHLFREGAGSVTVTFPSGTSHAARLLKIDQAADLAALAIAEPRVAPVAIAAVDKLPRRGEPLVSCGYGPSGQMQCNHGQMLGYASIVGGHAGETLELTGSARSGDSRGPVLNARRELVAVLFATDGRVVDATFCGRVRHFLTGLLPTTTPPPANAAPSAPPVTTAPPVVNLAPSTDDAAARIEQIVARMQEAVRGLNTKVDALQGVVEKEEEESQTQRTSEDISAVGPLTPGPSPARGEGSKRGAEEIVDAATRVAEPWLTAKAAALLISLGVPGGIAGLAAGGAVWLIMRRGKKRLQAKLARVQIPPSADPTVDPAVVERHHNQYVPYEVTALDKAWAAAHAQVGQKYPAAVAYLKLAEGVKDQLLSGRSE